MHLNVDIVIRSAEKQDSRSILCISEGGTADDRLDWVLLLSAAANDKAYFDGKGNPDTGKDFPVLDIDHLNLRIQRKLLDWIGSNLKLDLLAEDLERELCIK